MQRPVESSMTNNNINSQHQLSFTGGSMVEFVASTIISEVDKQKARVRILDQKKKAKSQRDRILSIAKKMTAGKLVLEGRSFHLNEHVLEQAQRRQDEKLQKINEKKKKADLIYLELCDKADKAYARNSNCDDVSKWKNSKDILAVIRPLKNNKDKLLLNNKF